MKYQRKTIDEFELWVKSMEKWEKVTSSHDRNNIMIILNKYRENDHHAERYKVIRKRVKKEVANV
jgi:biotin-(acetyl-CoA carboxylase) ligase